MLSVGIEVSERTQAAVKAAAGHSSLVTTSVYLHIAVDDDAEVGRLFANS